MAKIKASDLLKKYNIPQNKVSGHNYRKIMNDIIQNNTENTGKAVGRISRENFEKQFKKVRVGEQKRMILPDVSEALPKRSVFMRKSAERGQILSDGMRDRLTRDLRKTLESHTARGRPTMVRAGGRDAGTISPALIEDFQKRMTKTFSDYRKRDPETGVPKNIKAIAITEVRSAVDDAKEQYNRKFYHKNQGSGQMWREWIQNKQLAKQPRHGHDPDIIARFTRGAERTARGVRVRFEEEFVVPVFLRRGGRFIYQYTEKMRHPHDPRGSAGQVINCNCDSQYYFELYS
jgi:hypothetical protein